MTASISLAVEAARIRSAVAVSMAWARTTYLLSEVIRSVRAVASASLSPRMLTSLAATSRRRSADFTADGMAASRSRSTVVARTTVPLRS
jgi:hypothetical protein